MTLEALLIVLMAGTEIFRPLRDLRSVLHQGMVGQSAAAGINAILGSEAPRLAGTGAPVATLAPTIAFDDVRFAYPGGRAPRMTGCRSRSRPASASASSARAAREVFDRAPAAALP